MNRTFGFLIGSVQASLTRSLQAQNLFASTYEPNVSVRIARMYSAFAHLHTAVSFAANIAKILWGRPKAAERGKTNARALRLRNLLGIASDLILNDTKLRNSLEHLDERVDRWAEHSTTGNIGFFNVSPRGAIDGLQPIEQFMEYDPTCSEMRNVEESVDTKALAASVGRIQAAVKLALANA